MSVESKQEPTEYAPENNYHKYNLVYGKYKYKRLSPDTGTPNVTLSLASTTDVDIELPADVVFNLAKSHLYHVLNIAATGVATRYNNVHANVYSHIQEIRFMNRSNVDIGYIRFAQNYQNVALPRKTKYADYLARTPDSCMYKPGGWTGAQTNTTTGNFRPNGTSNADYSLTNNGDEPLWIRQSTVEGAGPDGASAMTVPRRLAFEDYPDTIFSLDKDLCFPEVTIMRITFAPANRFCWQNTSATVPATGAADVAAAPTLTGVSLYLNTQQDPEMVKLVRGQMRKGIAILVPYVNAYQFNIVGTAPVIQQRLNRIHGERLLKVIVTCYNAAQTYTNSLLCSNVGNAVVQNYYSEIDNNKIQDVTLDCTLNLDYNLNRDAIKGSVINGIDRYKYLWHHVDDFSYEVSPSDNIYDVPRENIKAGLPLDTEIQYQFTAAVNDVVHNFFVFLITQRTLIISPEKVGLT